MDNRVLDSRIGVLEGLLYDIKRKRPSKDFAVNQSRKAQMIRLKSKITELKRGQQC